MKRTIFNPLFKDTITFLETTAETGGAYSLHKLTLMPGGKNLSHVHTGFDETFTAINGVVGIHTPEGDIFLGPRESFTVSKNQVHHFFNPGDDEISFLVRFSPGHEGMENALRILYGMASDGLTDKKGVPKNIYATAILMEMSNSYPTGLMSLMKTPLRYIAKKGRKKGIEKKLMSKYCRT